MSRRLVVVENLQANEKGPDLVAKLAGKLAGIAADIERSERRMIERRAMVPIVSYPPELPITERRDELVNAIRDHQVVIVAGETGSGKSTQLPKLCLEAGRGVGAMIGHTQPRRIAARTIAERIAEELGTTVGNAVGYTVRFTDRVSDATFIKVMTDGILLAETQRDRDLLRYDTIIIDEAHERSLNIDFLLGYLKQLIERRPDLKIIITSATIDTARFSAHFGDAPIIEVSGRGYPVEVRYRPFGQEPEDDRDQTQAICDAIAELGNAGTGDVLVFLSGEREIHDTADALRRLQLRDTEILPLYARLSAADQHRIFRTHPGRRVVLSTNVAETSLTVPGVRYVIDAGTARISRFSRRLKVQRLPIEAISQASANQRAGRCGRVAPGICIRLYAEDDFTSRTPFTDPEILRTNLASVILQMAVLGLGEVADFPFVDPPDSRTVKDGVALLEELGAFAPAKNRVAIGETSSLLTPVGRQLAQLPLDPRIGRMVLEAERHDCVREVMVIAAALSIQDPRERPNEKQQAADEMHSRFRADGSDFVGLLNLWTYLREQQRALSGSQFRKLCKAEYLNYLRVREWQDINSQLRQVVSAMGITVHGGAEHETKPDHIHQAVLAGILSQIGMRDGDGREFRGTRNARFSIAGGSALAKKPPRWVMAAELVETNRLWARSAASIRPEWVERIGVHLCQVTHSEPRWQRDRASVVATERVTLLGLPIVTGRTVEYARIDPVLARDLFIRHALVEGDWDSSHPFLAENRQRMTEVRALEDRARRRDILVDDDGIEALYAARIPTDITSGRRFDQWWKQTRDKQPDRLSFAALDLLDPRGADLRLEDFPELWRQGTWSYPLTYEFEPGSPTDGVTVHVPLTSLHQISAAGFEWHVPGHRVELVETLMRTLPKPLRRHLIPMGDRAREFATEFNERDGPLVDVLAEALSEVARIEAAVVRATELDLDRLPGHLRFTFAVEDDDGRRLAAGKDLTALKTRLAGQVREAIAQGMPVAERKGLLDWTIGDLPKQVSVAGSAHDVHGFPALVDEGKGVALRILTTAPEQARAMRTGTRRLLFLSIPLPRKGLERLLSNEVKLGLARAGSRATAGITLNGLVDDCLLAAIDSIVAANGGPVWTEAEFVALRNIVKADLADAASNLMRTAGSIVMGASAIDSRLDALTSAAAQPSVDDMRQQLAWLVHGGFVTATGAARLPDVWRYVRGVEQRLDKLGANLARDQQRACAVQAVAAEIADLHAQLPPHRGREAVRLRWMLEELRISVFAQNLGTAHPVSEQRIRKEIQQVFDQPQ